VFVQSKRDRAEELRRPPAGRGPGTAGRAANRA
jgi:hypothetical protein